MRKFLIKILGETNYIKLETLKKRWWPTTYDKEQSKFLDEQVKFYGQFIKQGDLCFDVGGNVGLKTNVFLKLKARVVTLEPQQNCVTILKAKYGNKATILQKGAGAQNVVQEFYVSNDSPLSSFAKDWVNEMKDSRFHGSSIERVDQIELVTLDSLITTYGKPGFIKIDVEGYEIEVLKGLSKSFGSLSFEYAVPEKRNEITACLQEMGRKFTGLVCNYAVCNESQLALKEWLPLNIMESLVLEDDFNATFAGDIYIKQL